MWQLYLIEQLDNFQVFAGILLCTFGIIELCLGIFLFLCIDDDERILSSKYFKRYLPFLIGSAFLFCIIPNTKSTYRMIAIDTTLEYLKNNDTAKQIPDKMIKVIDKYLDDFSEDKKDK